MAKDEPTDPREARLDALSETDRARVAEMLEDRRLAVAWREKARPKQLPPWDPRRPLAEWTGYEGYPPGCTGPDTCDLGAPEDPADVVEGADYCDHAWGTHAYRTAYKQGGRGAGKTWTGAGAFCELVLWLGGTDRDGNSREYGIVGPTHDTAWSVCVESQSGIRRILGDRIVSANRTSGEIVLRNGATIYVTGADTGAPRLQGKNLTAVWADEIGLWRVGKWAMAWVDGVEFATRKAPHLVIATGTPKMGHPLVRYLVEDPAVHRIIIPTLENAKNLGRAFLAKIKARYGGTRTGRQELDGEFLTDVPGALWTLGLIDAHRVGPVRPATEDDPGYTLPDFRRIVIGWDPANTANSKSDEHGIVVLGITAEEHLYVIADYSGVFTPDGACRIVAQAYDRHQADAVAVERTGAQDWIFTTIEQTVPHLSPAIRRVDSRRGKWLRAEPIVAVTEQGRLHLVRREVRDGDHGSIIDHLDTLVGQMTTWLPESKESPDRMDAMVHGATELLSSTTAITGGTRSQRRGEVTPSRRRRR